MSRTTHTTLLLLLATLLASALSASVSVEYFQGVTGSNAFLATNGARYLLVDTGSSEDASLVIAFLQSFNVPRLDLIFITHGHPDHFGAVGAIVSAFSTTQVAVASADIKSELLTFASLAGITDYDFETNLAVIEQSPVLASLGLSINTNFDTGESLYASVLINRNQNFVFGGDIVGVDSHVYLGEDVDIFRASNWLKVNLPLFTTGGALGLDNNTILYPGHGLIGDNSYVADTTEYINFFVNVLLQCLGGQFPSLEEVYTAVLARYPNYINTWILDFMPGNTNWITAQEYYGVCDYEDPNYFGLDKIYIVYYSDAQSLSLVSSFILLLLAIVLN